MQTTVKLKWQSEDPGNRESSWSVGPDSWDDHGGVQPVWSPTRRDYPTSWSAWVWDRTDIEHTERRAIDLGAFSTLREAKKAVVTALTAREMG